MADQTVPTGANLEDIIVLGGQAFPITGKAQGDNLAEFEVGLKTGPAGYDTRTQAFFHVYNDFSGGMGYRRADLRDAKTLNTFWDYPEDGTAADTRRPGHLTLGPRRVRQVVESPETFPSNGRISPSLPYTTDGTSWAFGYGSALYVSSDGVNFQKTYDNQTGFCSALVPYAGAYRGFQAVYFAIFRDSAVPYAYNTDDSLNFAGVWTAGRTLQSSSDTTVQDAVTGPQTTVVSETGTESTFDVGTGKTTKIVLANSTTTIVATNGDQTVTIHELSTGLDGANETGTHQKDTTTVTTTTGGNTGTLGKNPSTPFNVFRFTDGIYWDEKVIVGAKNQGILFGIISPSDDLVHWNVEDPNDATFVGMPLMGGDSQVKFVGIEKAPWGEPAPYFAAGGQTGADLWVLDFYSRKVYPIKVGLEIAIRDGKVWSGKVCVTDGENLFAYDVGRQIIENIGFPRIDGHFPTLHTPSGDDMLLSYLLPSDIYMYAVARPDTMSALNNYSDLYCYNGKGWHRIGSHITNNYASYAAVAGYVNSDDPRHLHIFGENQADTSFVIDTIRLQSRSHIPVYGIDEFETDGGLISSWNDGGFSDIDGAALKMTIDARHLSSTETVTVEYQLNNNESGTWYPTYDADGNPADFSDTVDTLYFQSASPAAGAEFRTIRFRFTLHRGNTITATPEVKAFTFIYLKKPTFRSTWTFEIDINRMLEASGDTTWLVDGNTPTMARIWAKLQTLRNTLTLLPLSVPSIEAHDLNVTIVGMPLNFDDFRATVKSKGSLSLKVLEPISRAA